MPVPPIKWGGRADPVTASNMMGSGVFMLPTNLAGVGYISLWGWLFTIIGVIALALVFAKTSLITPRNGGIVAYASDAFGPFIGFQTTVCYWISAGSVTSRCWLPVSVTSATSSLN